MENITKSNYLSLEIVDNGLILRLTQAGKREIKDLMPEGFKTNKDKPFLEHTHFCQHVDFVDFFEQIRCNSEFIYFDDMGEAGFGLTSAPGITDGYYYNDDAELTDKGHDDSAVYWYPNYCITDFIEELYTTGKTFFQKA